MSHPHPPAHDTPIHDEIFDKILTPDALQFLGKLHRNFNQRRLDLLALRKERQIRLNNGEKPDFLKDTLHIRQDKSWKVAKAPADFQKRWVEITGPTDSKMIINALNSGADVFMADFEDANSPTWSNILHGQANLIDAIAGTLQYTSPDGKHYQLNDKRAVLTVRPRGWHLNEKHFQVNEEEMSASLFDFGLAFFHNAKALLAKGSGPYFYLPKMESHLEARLWNDVFLFAQKELGIPQGTIRATVLIETILAVFEMEEILYELREHSAGLNAGRWDYIFSIIKKFQNQKSFTFPDRSMITMTIPCMRAYSLLLVKTCHERGAFAMGGMSAFVPSRKDQAVNENALEKVREDKMREAQDGFDGTWVAHPDLVKVAHDIFEKALDGKPNQLSKIPSTPIDLHQLLNFRIENEKISEQGVRQNISVALQYLHAWLHGTGAVALYNLMEDAATAEISRAQLWQWVHHEAHLDDGRQLTPELYQKFIEDEVNKIAELSNLSPNNYTPARALLDHLVLTKDFPDFLTLEAYQLLS